MIPRGPFVTFLRIWIVAPFAWRALRSTTVWVYSENEVTGQRMATWRGGGYQPLDRSFIRDGDVVHARRGSYTVGSESEVWLA